MNIVPISNLSIRLFFFKYSTFSIIKCTTVLQDISSWKYVYICNKNEAVTLKDFSTSSKCKSCYLWPVWWLILTSGGQNNHKLVINTPDLHEVWVLKCHSIHNHIFLYSLTHPAYSVARSKISLYIIFLLQSFGIWNGCTVNLHKNPNSA